MEDSLTTMGTLAGLIYIDMTELPSFKNMAGTSRATHYHFLDILPLIGDFLHGVMQSGKR